MILVVDCGNTRIKWAHSDGGRLLGADSAQHRDDADAALDTLVASVRPGVTAAFVSNVAGPGLATKIDTALTAALGSKPRFAAVSRKAHGLECGYREPSRLGVDRWLAMVAAVQHADGPVCVLGTGTAVTFDAVDGAGRHLGGLILAGPRLASAALDEGTVGIGRTALPERRPAGLGVLGRSTDEAVGHGTLLGVAAALDRAVALVAAELGRPPAAILTGGDAERVHPWLETEVQLRADLVLEGLNVVAGDSGSRRA